MTHRTPAYWPTRIMLVVGLIATAVVLLLAGGLMRQSEQCFGCDYPDVLGLPSNVMSAALGVAVAVFGIVWMLRIFRGPRNEPHRWRYRDR